jgi:predicted transcriptional regulator
MARPAANRTLAEQAWIDRNPLRQWRGRKRFSLLDAATALHVSTVSLRFYETDPTKVPSERIAGKLLAGVSPSITDDLAAWREQVPAREATAA